jgi:hypothetical protein
VISFTGEVMIRPLVIMSLLIVGLAPAPSALADEDYAASLDSIVRNIDDPAVAPAPLEVATNSTWDKPVLAAGGSGCCNSIGSRWYISADYRLIRTHFSEAVAFATATTIGSDTRVVATELDFDYESSFAIAAGYHLSDCSELRLSYWYLFAETEASGEAAGPPTQFIVDPFGLVGTEIDTRADVRLNVIDLEYLRRVEDECARADLTYSAGVRFADVNQFYISEISGVPSSEGTGTFEVDFFGVGPFLTLTGRVGCGSHCQWSLFAKAGAAVLVGQYDIAVDVVMPTGATGGQSAERTRAVPILDTELGASWQPNSCVRISAGWLVHAWMNIGVSGGTFKPLGQPDPVFVGADDADVMSFDGLFIRAEVGF